MIAIIILAAGEAKRMGQCKQLLMLGGKPMVWQTANTACRAALGPVVLVTGNEADKISAAVADLPVVVVYNPDWVSGQSSSVRSGVAALGETCEAAIFLPADQPLVTVNLLQDLAQCYRTRAALAVVPQFQGKRSSPVLFDLACWRQALTSLKGDIGGRELLQSRPEQVIFYEVTDGSLLIDADSPLEYEQVKQLWLPGERDRVANNQSN